MGPRPRKLCRPALVFHAASCWRHATTRRDQLADIVLTLLFAGHDTSATTLTRVFDHLGKHPEAAGKLRQEQVCLALWGRTC